MQREPEASDWGVGKERKERRGRASLRSPIVLGLALALAASLIGVAFLGSELNAALAELRATHPPQLVIFRVSGVIDATNLSSDHGGWLYLQVIFDRYLNSSGISVRAGVFDDSVDFYAVQAVQSLGYHKNVTVEEGSAYGLTIGLSDGCFSRQFLFPLKGLYAFGFRLWKGVNPGQGCAWSWEIAATEPPLP